MPSNTQPREATVGRLTVLLSEHPGVTRSIDTRWRCTGLGCGWSAVIEPDDPYFAHDVHDEGEVDWADYVPSLADRTAAEAAHRHHVAELIVNHIQPHRLRQIPPVAATFAARARLGGTAPRPEEVRRG